ncbi:MAG: serine protease AprX [Frankiales bacterium]|nr:serine protease AprX [Frankiales bacterium]
MPASQHKRRAASVLTALTAPALVLSALVAGSPAASAASTSPTSVPSGRAVVALTGVTSVTVPGVTVDAVLSSIHSELVHGSAAALRRLAAAPGVLGVAADKTIKPTGYELNQNGGSVFSWEGLGDEAGRPGAGAGVHVALIDTGVSDSAYLNRASGHLVDAIDTSAVVTGGTSTTDGVFADGYGHGTFMASLIAGGGSVQGHRTLGVAPGAIVDVVKVAGADGTSSFGSMMAGLNWVALNAATESVANLSFGLAPDEVGGYGQDPLNLATETLRYLGTNVVVSSGNTAGEVSDPGFDPRVITVGAADTRKGSPKLAPFSGSAVVAGVAKPDLVAPGVGMLGTLPPTSSIVAANPAALQSNGFYRGSGTSEATAVVSGLAALFVADHRSATTAQVKASLRAAASTIHARGSGAGLANVAERLARSRDDSKMGDAGALGEGNFDSSAWSNNGWGVSAWGSVWNHNRWGTGSWATQAWSQLSWEQNRWGSASWDYNRWGSDSWDFNRWGNNRWGNNRWGTSTWDHNRWGADAWGSDYWGSDGGDDA